MQQGKKLKIEFRVRIVGVEVEDVFYKNTREIQFPLFFPCFFHLSHSHTTYHKCDSFTLFDIEV